MPVRRHKWAAHTHNAMLSCTHPLTHTLSDSYESRRWSRSILAWWFIHLLLAITENIVSAPPINLCYFPQQRALESRGSLGNSHHQARSCHVTCPASHQKTLLVCEAVWCCSTDPGQWNHQRTAPIEAYCCGTRASVYIKTQYNHTDMETEMLFVA